MFRVLRRIPDIPRSRPLTKDESILRSEVLDRGTTHGNSEAVELVDVGIRPFEYDPDSGNIIRLNTEMTRILGLTDAEAANLPICFDFITERFGGTDGLDGLTLLGVLALEVADPNEPALQAAHRALARRSPRPVFAAARKAGGGRQRFMTPLRCSPNRAPPSARGQSDNLDRHARRWRPVQSHSRRRGPRMAASAVPRMQWQMVAQKIFLSRSPNFATSRLEGMSSVHAPARAGT